MLTIFDLSPDFYPFLSLVGGPVVLTPVTGVSLALISLIKPSNIFEKESNGCKY